MLRLDLHTYTWTLVDNYGDIPSVRMGTLRPRPFLFFRVLGISNAWEIAEISTLRLLADDTCIYRSHNHLLAG